jgi:hypothetical protein
MKPESVINLNLETLVCFVSEIILKIDYFNVIFSILKFLN